MVYILIFSNAEGTESDAKGDLSAISFHARAHIADSVQSRTSKSVSLSPECIGVKTGNRRKNGSQNEASSAEKTLEIDVLKSHVMSEEIGCFPKGLDSAMI